MESSSSSPSEVQYEFEELCGSLEGVVDSFFVSVTFGEAPTSLFRPFFSSSSSSPSHRLFVTFNGLVFYPLESNEKKLVRFSFDKFISLTLIPSSFTVSEAVLITLPSLPSKITLSFPSPSFPGALHSLYSFLHYLWLTPPERSFFKPPRKKNPTRKARDQLLDFVDEEKERKVEEEEEEEESFSHFSRPSQSQIQSQSQNQVYAERKLKKLREKTQDSLTQSLRICEETTEVGRQTLNTLHAQGEQIQSTKRAVEEIEEHLNVADYVLKSMSSVGGFVVNLFSKPPQPPLKSRSPSPSDTPHKPLSHSHSNSERIQRPFLNCFQEGSGISVEVLSLSSKNKGTEEGVVYSPSQLVLYSNHLQQPVSLEEDPSGKVLIHAYSDIKGILVEPHSRLFTLQFTFVRSRRSRFFILAPDLISRLIIRTVLQFSPNIPLSSSSSSFSNENNNSNNNKRKGGSSYSYEQRKERQERNGEQEEKTEFVEKRLNALSSVLGEMGSLGNSISTTLDEQNALLSDLDDSVSNTTNHVENTTRKTNRLL